MVHKKIIHLLVIISFRLTTGVRINFTNCQNPEWTCINNTPQDIVYTCSIIRSNDFIIHLKDYYTDHITSVTVQNCRDVRVVLDCPILQRSSQLQKFKIKDCDRLEFVTLSSSSLLQTPPEMTIENVREIVSLPRGMFKSPATNTELKCLGSSSLRKIRIVNSKINSVVTKAFYNVTGIKVIEFENVTMTDIQTQAIEAVMGNDNTAFKILNCNIDGLDFKGITVQGTTVTISDNTFTDVISNTMNITSEYLYITGNIFKEISANGLILKSVYTDISDNDIKSLKTNALSSVKCTKKGIIKKQFSFSRNKIENINSNSLFFDYSSCESIGTDIIFAGNKMDCKCRNIAFLNSASSVNELSNIVLNVANNNTCLSAPCLLPVEIVKLLLESDMCQLNLDPQVMCLLYNDKHSNDNEATTDEEITEPAPTFYLIRQANSPNGDASAAMTAIDKDDLLKDTNLNMTNRTTIKVVFDSSKDFVETLRSTSTSRAQRPAEEPKTPPRNEYVNRCVGAHCRNNVAYDRQKALDFYKYVYAQLRTPRQNDNKKKKS